MPNKGVWGKAEWVPRRVLQDLSNNGIQIVKLHIETDQELAMVNVQTAKQELSPDRIIPLNSLVGESECNARVENAIRRVHETARALRHHVEHHIKAKIPDDAHIMSWMVRWAAVSISKYAAGEDGKTPYERIRQEDCVILLVPFGGTVMFFQIKTVHRNKGTPAKRMGIWLGISERIEEVLIGTKYGVVKCRIVNRLDEEARWNKNGVMEMKGAPWEPIPGTPNQHIPVDVADNGDHMGLGSESEEAKVGEIDDENEGNECRINVDKLHVSQKVVRKFGTTLGCAACSAIQTKGGRPGRIGRHHSDECRKRVMAALEKDPQYRRLIQRASGASPSKEETGAVNMGTIDNERDFSITHTRDVERHELERHNHSTEAHTAHDQCQKGNCTHSEQNRGREGPHGQIQREQFGHTIEQDNVKYSDQQHAGS